MPAPRDAGFGPGDADRLATSLKTALECLVVPLSRAAAAFVRAHGWALFGFARPGDHARERYGRSGRWLRNLAALGDALHAMPRLERALTGADGCTPLGRVAALAVARVASPVSLEYWLRLARVSTVRQLHEAVRRARATASASPAGVASSPPESPDPHPGPDHGTHPGREPDPRADPRDDYPDRELIRFLVPAPVADAFDEAVDLFRAIEGHQAPVASFLEALVAESSTGTTPPDVETVPPGGGLSRALREQALAAASDSWKHLPESAGPGRTMLMAENDLASFRGLAREAGSGDPAALDRQIRSLLEIEDVLQARLGRLLVEMGERGAWSRLMFAGVGHYAEERLRLSRTHAEDRARAARGMRSHAHLRAAYESGQIGLAAALIILRILGSGATRLCRPDPLGEEVEKAWVARATEATIKRLRDEARALGFRGTLPRLDSPDGIATRRPLEDAEWHASLARPPGRSRRRILRLGLEALLQAGGRLPGSDSSDGMITCASPSGAGGPAGAGNPRVIDASSEVFTPSGPDVFLRLRLPADVAADFLGAVESRRRELTARVDRVPWHEPWPAAALPSLLAARTFSTRSRRIPSWVGLLALLEEFALTWDTGATRASEAVYIRDGWRCTAPGCTSRRNLEDHHLVYRSRGGGDALENRTCLCRFHHQRGEHGDLASCNGTAPLGIVWRLGRPEVAVSYRNERRLPG